MKRPQQGRRIGTKIYKIPNTVYLIRDVIFLSFWFLWFSFSPMEEVDKEAYKVKLAKRIRHLRLAKGYKNYEQFAYSHNFSRSQVARYEKGEDIRFLTLVRLAHAFGMTIEEFFSEGFDSSEDSTK